MVACWNYTAIYTHALHNQAIVANPTLGDIVLQSENQFIS